MKAIAVSTTDELIEIQQLSMANFRQNLTEEEQKIEGFITWPYSLDLLQRMHQLAPAVIVKDDRTVAGYALTTPIETRSFHPALDHMFRNLEQVQYNGRLLFSYNFYCMGQICVAKEFRGRGIVEMLYRKHNELYSKQFDFILTEISTSNHRSIKAHERIGFQSIYRYSGCNVRMGCGGVGLEMKLIAHDHLPILKRRRTSLNKYNSIKISA